MTRSKAAAGTVATAVACWALGWALENYPNATFAGLSLGAIYLKLRGLPDGDPRPGSVSG